MEDSAQAYWNVVRKICGDDDPNLSRVGHERTCLLKFSLTGEGD